MSNLFQIENNPFIELKNILTNRKEAIIFDLKLNDITFQVDDNLSIFALPKAVSSFYSIYESLTIHSPRYFEILAIKNWSLVDDNYILFSKIDSYRIAFNIQSLNEAEEWDIINLESKFVVTKTFKSYLFNKMLAWIDRSRLVWQTENH